MAFSNFLDTYREYWPATKEENERAYKFVNRRITRSRNTQIITGERGLFKTEDFFKVCLNNMITLHKPEIDVFSYTTITTKKEESGETKIVRVAEKILDQIEEGYNREIFLKAIQTNLLRLWQTNTPIEIPHITFFDNRDVYLQRLHEPSQDVEPYNNKEMWFVENAFYLKWKYMPKVKKIKNSSILLNPVFRRIQL